MADEYSLHQLRMELLGDDFSDSNSERNKLASENLARIPELSSREEWFRWESKIRIFLDLAQFKHFLGRDKEEPALAEGESEAYLKLRIARWRERQCQACARVESRLGPHGQMLLRDKEPNLHVFMELLRNHFKPNRIDLARLFLEYSSLQLADCSDVSDYASKLTNLRRCIESIDPSCKIGYPLLTIRFLDGLGPDYTTFAIRFSHNGNLLPERDPKAPELRIGETRGECTFHEAISAAITLERNMKERQAREEQSRQIEANMRNRRRARGRERGR